jgi:hypothetical protein
MLYLAYLAEGGTIEIEGVPAGMSCRWMDPRSGRVVPCVTATLGRFTAPDAAPWVLAVSGARGAARQ